MGHIIKGFEPLSGKHCVSNSLRQLFHFQDINISEEMIFGMASALNFIYMEYQSNPFIGGRNGISEFEGNLSRNLGINMPLNKTSSERKAMKDLKNQIDEGNPVLIYVDMYFLGYLNLDFHFGGHAVVVFGYDDKNENVYISDRDDDNHSISSGTGSTPLEYHLVPYHELTEARKSKFQPFPVQHKWLVVEKGAKPNINKDSIYKAIKDNIEILLRPRIRNLGVKGIKTFSEKIQFWYKLPDDIKQMTALNCFFMIDKSGGTGGGAFRTMYGDFLKECGNLLNLDRFVKFGDTYKNIGADWDDVAQQFKQLSGNYTTSLVNQISSSLIDIFNAELDLLTDLERFLTETQ